MKVRARDLGLPFAGSPGPNNAITDVPGVEVGLKTIIEGEGPVTVGKGPIRTGVTAILPYGKEKNPSYIWAGIHSFNGNGEMTGSHWINDAGYFISPICITNTHSVGIAHHATVKWMINQYEEHFQKHHAFAMPVIAETYDGLTNDICGLHLKEEHFLEALNTAASGPVAEGNVGGGTGMKSYEFKAGTGTSSRRFDLGGTPYIVGVLVQSNFGMRDDFMVLGVPVGKELTEDKVSDNVRLRMEMGSIIVIIGTDVPLNPIQLKRLAKRATLGMARTGCTGGNSSGDIFLAFSVANKLPLLTGQKNQPVVHNFEFLNEEIYIDSVYWHTVHAVEEAILNAIVAGRTLSAIKPSGFNVPGIDHARLVEVMRKYNRLTP